MSPLTARVQGNDDSASVLNVEMQRGPKVAPSHRLGLTSLTRSPFVRETGIPLRLCIGPIGPSIRTVASRSCPVRIAPRTCSWNADFPPPSGIVTGELLRSPAVKNGTVTAQGKSVPHVCHVCQVRQVVHHHRLWRQMVWWSENQAASLRFWDSRVAGVKVEPPLRNNQNISQWWLLSPDGLRGEMTVYRRERRRGIIYRGPLLLHGRGSHGCHRHKARGDQ